MKNKASSCLLLLTAAALLCWACNKSFLDVQPKGIQLESNYYQTPDQAFAGLVAAYNPLGWEASGSFCDKLGALNSASDECFTGGGGPTDMSTWQAWNSYTLSGANGPQGDIWNRNYTGIGRANTILAKLGKVPGLSAALQTRYAAEAKFLRAYYYFELVRLFKNIVLITGPVDAGQIYSLTQTSADSVYQQIEKDLNASIADLPAKVDPSENGRVTRGGAKALLAKAILFEGNNTRMAEAAALFEDINKAGNDYGYSLLVNFPEIFDPANKFNSESVFEITHTGVQNANWGGWPNYLGNVYTQMTGPRSYSGPIYWSGGWSFNPITPNLVNAMKGDPRYPYTIANIDSIVNAVPGRSYTKGYANTGYFIQKYAPLAQYVSKTGTAELNFPNDYIEIRLADTYLMEAEALIRGGGDVSKAQFYLDQVRGRVGLASVPATLDNIYNERRMELATEGHRWFDLVRTGQAAAALAFKGFKAGTNEILPIPLGELNNTKLKQNPNYN